MSHLAAMPGSVAVSKDPIVRVRDVWYTFDRDAARVPPIASSGGNDRRETPPCAPGNGPGSEEQDREKSKWVLKNNNLELYPGEIVIMTGQSGSGKTTLLTLIGGLRRLQHGSITVLGEELSRMDERALIRLRRGIGFIFQAHNLFGSLTAVQNVRLALEVDGDPAARYRTDAEIQRRAEGILTDLCLGKRMHHKPQKLSGGQKQRVAIARALANEPRLILADEPTAALDAESADIVVRLLKEVVASGERSVVVVTHDTKILESAHRIVNMKYGEIISNINVPRAREICRFLQDQRTLKELIPGIWTELDFAIADGMTEERFPAGQPIIRYQEHGDKFYVVRSGSVEVRKPLPDGEVLRVDLDEGQFFGERALLTDEKRNADVVAKTDVELLVLTKEQFQKILKDRTEFGNQILDVMSYRS